MPAIVLQGRVNLQKIKVFSPNYTISADSVICIIEMLLTEYHEENKPHTSDEWERWKIKYHCCHLYSSMEGVTLSIVFVHAAVKSRVFSLLFYCISIAPFCVFIEHTTHFVFSWPRVNKASTLPYCLTPDMLELQLGDVSIAQLCSLFLSCLHPHFIWSGWLLLASLNPFFVCMCVRERKWSLKELCCFMVHKHTRKMSKIFKCRLNFETYFLFIIISDIGYISFRFRVHNSEIMFVIVWIIYFINVLNHFTHIFFIYVFYSYPNAIISTVSLIICPLALLLLSRFFFFLANPEVIALCVAFLLHWDLMRIAGG